MASISALHINNENYEIIASSALWAQSGTEFTANTLNANEAVINGDARINGILYANTINGKVTSATSANNADTIDGLHASDFALKTGNYSANGLVAKSASTAQYAVSAGAAPVASHQLSSHTNFSTYFTGTSAKTAEKATSATSAAVLTDKAIKVNSAATADIANSIKSNYSNTTLSAGYATATNTAIKVNSAITAQTALHLTANVADNYTALSAGSAKNAGTAYTVTGHVPSALSWSGVSAEVNKKIGGVYQIQGDASWSSISANNNNKKNGYVYNITGGVDSNSKDKNNNVISVGDNVVYVTAGTAGWDKLASTIDTSNFVKTGTSVTLTASNATNLGGAASSNFTNSSLSGYKAIKFGANTFNGAGSVGSTLEVTASTNIAFVGSGVNKIGISAKDTTYTSLASVNSTQYNNLTAVSSSYTANSATMLSGSTALVKAGNLVSESLKVNNDVTANTINANEAVINGDTRVLGTLYADTISGKIASADIAVNATQLGTTAASDFALKTGNYSANGLISKSASTAQYAVSAAAAPVASHQLSSHTNFSTYFNGTSAKTTEKATSATSAAVLTDKAIKVNSAVSANYSLNADTLDNIHASGFVDLETKQKIAGIKTFEYTSFPTIKVRHSNTDGTAAGIKFYPCSSDSGMSVGAGSGSTGLAVEFRNNNNSCVAYINELGKASFGITATDGITDEIATLRLNSPQTGNGYIDASSNNNRIEFLTKHNGTTVATGIIGYTHYNTPSADGAAITGAGKADSWIYINGNDNDAKPVGFYSPIIASPSAYITTTFGNLSGTATSAVYANFAQTTQYVYGVKYNKLQSGKYYNILTLNIGTYNATPIIIKLLGRGGTSQTASTPLQIYEFRTNHSSSVTVQHFSYTSITSLTDAQIMAYTMEDDPNDSNKKIIRFWLRSGQCSDSTIFYTYHNGQGTITEEDLSTQTPLDALPDGAIKALIGGVVGYATSAQTALHLTANVADNYTALSAGSAKNAGTAYTVTGHVPSGLSWSGVSAEVDKKIGTAIGGVYQIQGDASWSSISANNNNKKNGYVYNITGGVDSNSKDKNGNVITSGDNVVYVTAGTAGWDKLASTIDTSNFVKTGTSVTLTASNATNLGGAASSNFTNSSLSGYKAIKFGANTFNGAGSVGSTLEVTASTNIAFVGSGVNKIGISAKDTTYTSLASVNSTQYNNLTAVSSSYTANSATMLSGSTALVKAGSLTTNNLYTTGSVSGASGKFTNLSATNITGTLQSVAPSASSASKAVSAYWTVIGNNDLERPLPIPYTNGSASWTAGSAFNSPMAYVKDDMTYNTNKKRLKVVNLSANTNSANNYTIENKARMQFNSTDNAIDFIFI